uniref:Aldehyde dehydrogenase 3 family, member B3 n=1 Tax=Mus musculus TaxID=10090 RepID=A0A087WS45_MOUSE
MSTKGKHPRADQGTDPFEEKLQRLKEAFNTGKTKTAKFRAEQLQSLGRFLQDNSKQLHDALDGDLGKASSQT